MIKTDLTSSNPAITISIILNATMYVIKDFSAICQSLKNPAIDSKNKNINS